MSRSCDNFLERHLDYESKKTYNQRMKEVSYTDTADDVCRHLFSTMSSYERNEECWDEHDRRAYQAMARAYNELSAALTEANKVVDS